MFRMRVTHAVRIAGIKGIVVSGIPAGGCKVDDPLMVEGESELVFRVAQFMLLNIRPFDSRRISMRLTPGDRVEPRRLEGCMLMTAPVNSDEG